MFAFLERGLFGDFADSPPIVTPYHSNQKKVPIWESPYAPWVHLNLTFILPLVHLAVTVRLPVSITVVIVGDALRQFESFESFSKKDLTRLSEVC